MKRFCLSAWVFLLMLHVIVAGARADEIPAVVTDDRVNVRGQPSLAGEVITQLNKGEQVVLLEEHKVEKPQPHEPAVWARIRMPANTPVWVSAAYIDPATKTVTASRLNMRAGPGENYSIVGRLDRGDTVKEIRTADGWMEIQTPEKAYAFVAADFLSKSAPATPAPAAEAETAQTAPTTEPAPANPEPTPAPVETAQEEIAKPAEPTQTPAETANSGAEVPNEPPAESVVATTPDTQIAPAEDVTTLTPAPELNPDAGLSELLPPPGQTVPTEPALVPEEPTPDAVADEAPKRIVRREGFVRTTKSIQAPSWFELVSTDTRKVINYLYTDDPSLNLKDYKGRKIIVTGEEGIDPRWPKTPVLEIETLEIAP